MAKFHGWYFWSRTQIDRRARLIIRLLFGFASESVLLNQSTNSETEMLSKHKEKAEYKIWPSYCSGC